MTICLVTGAAGLIGSESIRFFAQKGLKPVGIDNDMRKMFFGDDASILGNLERLREEVPHYTHHDEDIRNMVRMEQIFCDYGSEITLIIHAAAQPSHDWAAKEPFTDFNINAGGTLILLELARKYCPEATFIFTSTNKVYGDSPNRLPINELATRYEIDDQHLFFKYGIDETMNIDQSKHSLFGVSKTAADLMVQEYGRYYGLKTGCFRCGCLTGGLHAGSELHGFLSYLMQCAVIGKKYTVFGYKGKQVRDNMHSYDLVSMFWHFYRNPQIAEVYNVGGGRYSNCSVLEAIDLCEEVVGKKIDYSVQTEPRNGDHIWWISDIRKFRNHYPHWDYQYDLPGILQEIFSALRNKQPAAVKQEACLI